MPENQTPTLRVEIEEDPPRGRFKLVNFERNPDTHDVLA